MAIRQNPYNPLLNSKIQFLEGPQTALNTYLPSGVKDGQAVEGAFYLTNDTNRLYVGRQLSSDSTKIYPVQISASITRVTDTTELTSYADICDDGDLFYIQDDNILASVRKNYQTGETHYIQLNPATGITDFSTSGTGESTNKTLRINHSILAEDSSSTKDAYFSIQGGRNVNITRTSPDTSIDTYSSFVALIDSADFQLSSTASSDNTSTIKLQSLTGTSSASATPTITDCSSLIIKGATREVNDTSNVIYNIKNTVATSIDTTSNGVSTVSIEGIRPIGLTSAPRAMQYAVATVNNVTTFNNGTYYELIDGSYKLATSYNSSKTYYTLTSGSGGFELKFKYYNPLIDLTSNETGVVETSALIFNPAITLGQSRLETTYFSNGTAYLNTYTKDEVDAAITTQINNRISSADAMTYLGTVNSDTDLISKIKTGNDYTVHSGDTYKVSADFSPVVGVNAKVGDLIIFKGSEGANGYITGITDATLENYFDIIPSGDDTLLQYEFLANANSSSTNPAANILLKDSNHSNNTILNTYFYGWTSSPTANDNIITVVGSGNGTNSRVDLQIKHKLFNVTNTTNRSLINSVSNDGAVALGKDNSYKIFVLSDPNDIARDNYGHVTSVQGTYVTLRHNRLTNVQQTNTVVAGSWSTGNNTDIFTELGSGQDPTDNTIYRAQVSLGFIDRVSTSNSDYAAQANINFESKTLEFSTVTHNSQPTVVMDLVWKSF